MHWQFHLTTQPIRRVDILLDQLAVTESRQKISFYDVASGAHYQDLEIPLNLLDNPVPEERREGFSQLKALNGEYLPVVQFHSSHLYLSLDGSLRLIHDGDDGLTLEIDDQSVPLDIPHQKKVTQVHLDRDLGSIVAVTDDHLLYVFQQQTPLNTIFLEEAPVIKVFVRTGGSEIVLIYPEKLYQIDSAGRILHSREIHYSIGATAMSLNGDWLAIGDTDHQLIRLYNRDLTPVRQQHALDLIITAHPLQLFTARPPASAPISALDITDTGILAFSIAGILCVATAEKLTALPQPRRLF